MADPVKAEEVLALFGEALDLPPERRRAHIEAAATDEAVRREVFSLLTAHQHAGSRPEQLDPVQAAAMLGDDVPAEATAGRRIGPYRVVRELGHGGMGVVYLAERADGTYEQQVALKILPAWLSSEAQGQRFVRERQILARLEHPGIARLLDGGVGDDGEPYFALEYVRGEPLTRWCDERRLGVEERLRLFLRVCDAVQYAHRQLVVHRDLKPSNILVTPDGDVKLLDFGIAKLLGAGGAADATALTRATQRPLTPGYAAPEQHRGAPVTVATDVYSLGVLLYELLVGRRPYDAATAQSFDPSTPLVPPMRPSAAVLASPGGSRTHHLSRRLRGDLDTIVLQALREEPERRYGSVEALAIDLERHLQGLPVAARADSWLYRAGKLVRRHRFRLVVGAAVVLLIASSVATVLWTRRTASGELPFSVLRAQRVTFDSGLELDPAISPAGDAIAFAAGPLSAMRIHLRRLEESHAVPLSPVSLGHARHPRWSPDATRIAFQAAGSVWVVAPTGGEPVLLVEGEPTRAIRWLTWSPDGAHIAYVQGDAIWVRTASDGPPRRVAAAVDVHGLAWSPDSRRIAYVNGNSAFLETMDTPDASVHIGNLAPSSIWVVPARGGDARRITRDAHLDVSPVWTPDGRMLWFVSSRGGGRDIYGIPLDGRSRPIGSARRLTTGLQAHTIGLSADGRLLSYSSFAPTSNVYAIRIPDGEVLSSRDATPITSGSQVVEGLSVSPDGKWLAFDSNRLGNQNIFKMALPSGEPVRLTRHAEGDFMPAWSPDGREIAYHAFLGALRQIRIVSADGTRDRPAFPLRQEQNYPQWSPRGDRLAYHSGGTGALHLFLLTRKPDSTWGPPELLTSRPGSVARWSPDGRRLAFLGDNTLWTLDIETRRAHPVLSSEDSSAVRKPLFPLWSGDGHRLYFKANDTSGQAGIWSVAEAGGRPTLLVRFDDPLRLSSRAELATDGQRLYFTLATLESDIWTLELEPSPRER